MTVVAGIARAGSVWIGADSAGVSGWTLQSRADEKVFTREASGERWAFGCTTSFRMMQVIRYTLELPKPPRADLHRFMATAFVDALRECLTGAGFAEKHNERESGGEFLVGVRGSLFEIAENYQVGVSTYRYAAVGVGREVALGALAVTASSDHPRARIGRALRAAERHNIGVRRPFRVVVV